MGREEHFLLEQLNSGLSPEQLREGFATRFGQALSPEELEAFVDLAVEQGLLRLSNLEQQSTRAPVVHHQHLAIASRPTQLQDRQKADPLAKRVLGALLSGAEAMLQKSALCCKAAQQRIHFLHLKHFAFVPRPDDIFIVTYPRSGTTWLQMILYQLSTDGSMEIPHIAEYCPWFERSLRSGKGFETQPPPRIFKSHLPYRAIPKGPCKYIYVARDGRDVVVSYFHLYRMYCGFAGTFAEFFQDFMRGTVHFGSWFDHVHQWWEHRHDSNVLFLTYEELTRDLEDCLRKIVAFCGWTIEPSRLPHVLERCGFAFMKQHESKFDPTIETLWEQGVRLNSFLRTGKAGEGALQLSKGQQEQFAEAFCRHLGNTGLVHWRQEPAVESSRQAAGQGRKS
jgi:hypothetical protein